MNVIKYDPMEYLSSWDRLHSLSKLPTLSFSEFSQFLENNSSALNNNIRNISSIILSGYCKYVLVALDESLIIESLELSYLSSIFNKYETVDNLELKTSLRSGYMDISA